MQIPAVLPVIIAEARDKDLLVTVAGDSDHAQTVARSELGSTLASLVAELGVATRVEVHQADGRVLVDILEPPAPETSPGSDPFSDDRGGEAAQMGAIELTGEDFISPSV